MQPCVFGAIYQPQVPISVIDFIGIAPLTRGISSADCDEECSDLAFLRRPDRGVTHDPDNQHRQAGDPKSLPPREPLTEEEDR